MSIIYMIIDNQRYARIRTKSQSTYLKLCELFNREDWIYRTNDKHNKNYLDVHEDDFETNKNYVIYVEVECVEDYTEVKDYCESADM